MGGRGSTKFEIVSQEPSPIEYLKELVGLIEALHSTVFGVHALEDPEFSHRALSDNGQIHILVHTILRNAPSINYLKHYLSKEK